MRNILLLLVMISCMLSGYFIGDYRGKEARDALEDVVRTGKLAGNELQASNSRLKSELDTINDKYAKEVEQLHAEYKEDSARWQRSRNLLDTTIQQQSARLAELNKVLGELITALGRTSGGDKAQLEQKITILRSDINALMREMNGNSCLKAQAPRSVIETLNSVNHGGGGR